MVNFRFISNLIGRLLWVESFFMLVCFVVALLYGECDRSDFLYSFLITLAAGCAMVLPVKVTDRVLSRKDGYFIVACTWVAISLFGALPYLFGNTIPSVIDAIFETVSGFTTTGSSILNDIEALPHATLLWRSLTQWLGGMGIIVLFIAILPGLGIEGRDLYAAEVTGPAMNKSFYTFASIARHMWILYIVLTSLQCILLYLGDMGIFDAVCHSLTTMGTGGYSTKQASIAHWDSAYIQYIFVLFMFLAGINYSLLYSALTGRAGRLLRDEEFRLFAGIILGATLVVSIGLYVMEAGKPEPIFRQAIFQVVSIITSTGYATADYTLWPPLLGAIIFILLFVGGCAGSTAGGLKCVRLNLLVKNSLVEMKRVIHPHAVINVKYNGKSMHPNIMNGVMGFFILFIFIFGISTLVMAYFTEDLATACSSVVSAMSNMGPGFGQIGPMDNHAALPGFAKLFLAALMLVGRLEIFTILVLFSKTFWRR